VRAQVRSRLGVVAVDARDEVAIDRARARREGGLRGGALRRRPRAHDDEHGVGRRHARGEPVEVAHRRRVARQQVREVGVHREAERHERDRGDEHDGMCDDDRASAPREPRHVSTCELQR
jgi:hypothetical protein